MTEQDKKPRGPYRFTQIYNNVSYLTVCHYLLNKKIKWTKTKQNKKQTKKQNQNKKTKEMFM